MSRSGRYLMTGALILVACAPDPAPPTGPSLQQCQYDCDPPPPPPPPPLKTFTAVAMGRGNFNHLQVVLLGTDGKLYLHYQGHQSGAWTWAGSAQFQVPPNTTFDKITTGHGHDNNLHVIARRVSDNLLYVLHQSSATGAWYWDGLLPGGGIVNEFATALGNGFHVVGPSPSGPLGTRLTDRYQSGGPWLQNWAAGPNLQAPPDGPFTAVASAACLDDCLFTDVVALRAVDGGQFQGLPCPWRQTWGQGNETWQSLSCRSNPHGEKFSAVATGIGNQNQPQHVMLSATSGRPYLYYTTTSGVWIAADYLPNPNQVGFSKVAAGRGNNNNLQVVGLSLGKPNLIWQASGTGAWSWYGPLPNPENRSFTALAMARGNNDNLQVVLIGTDQLAYLIYQVSGSGNWIWGGRLQTQ